MMRPPSIVRFDRLFLAAIALWLIGTLLDWSLTVAQVESSRDIAIFGDRAALLVGGVIVVLLGIALLLWHRVARGGSRFARIAVTIFAAINAALLVGSLASGTAVIRPGTVAQMVAVVIELLAIRALFRADARAWFARPAPEHGA